MDKKRERARVLKKRNVLSSAKYTELNRALCGFVSDFLNSAEVKTISAFLPIGSEPNISEVLKNGSVPTSDRRVFLPVTEDKPCALLFGIPRSL